MIHLLSALFAKSKSPIESKLSEIESELKSKRDLIDQESRTLKDLERMVENNKKDLAYILDQIVRQTDELKKRVSREGIWLTAFTAGFEQAFSWILPILTKGTEKLAQTARDQAIDEGIDHIGKMVDSRINKLKLLELKELSKVVDKKTEFQRKSVTSKTDEEKKKYGYYVEALDWLLESKNGN